MVVRESDGGVGRLSWVGERMWGVVKEGNKSRDGMMNMSGVGQVAAGRLEDSIWAGQTEWWDKSSVDWLGG